MNLTIRHHSETIRWLNRQWLVILLCIFCFPVGMAGHWKLTEFSRIRQVVGTLLSRTVGLTFRYAFFLMSLILSIN